MIDWQREILYASVVGALILLIFIISELWKKFFNPRTEVTRKFVHFAAGAVSLGFSYIFKSHWTILGLCIIFVLVILITKKYNFLQSVHGVTRKTKGSAYYPVAIYVAFLFSYFFNTPHIYVIAVMVLAVSDSLAAVVGTTYGLQLYNVEEEKRSLEGSIIFFMATFIITHLGLLLLSDLGREECVVIGIYIAFIVTALESITLGGVDNLFIPLVTSFVLNRVIVRPMDELLTLLAIFIGVFILTFAVIAPTKKIGISGILGLALLGFASWALVEFHWFVPIFTEIILFSYFDFFTEIPKGKHKRYRIRSIFYTAGVSLIIMIVADQLQQIEHIFILPFIVSIAGNLSIFWERKSRLDTQYGKWDKPNFIRNAGFLRRALFLTLIFIPVQFIFSPQLSIVFTLVIGFLGTVAIDRIFWFIAPRIPFKTRRIQYLKIEFAITLTISLIILFLNWINYYIIPGQMEFLSIY